MVGSRRARRSLRALVAFCLVACGAALVLAAVVADRLTGAAALVCAAAALVAVALLHREVADVRACAAADRGRQAASYRQVLEERERRHRAALSVAAERTSRREAELASVTGQLGQTRRQLAEADLRACLESARSRRLSAEVASARAAAAQAWARAERAAATAREAEDLARREASRAVEAQARAERETEHRRTAQDRLAAVLDEVFGTRLYDLDRQDAQAS